MGYSATFAPVRLMALASPTKIAKIPLALREAKGIVIRSIDLWV
jgi:hypothetical protein